MDLDVEVSVTCADGHLQFRPNVINATEHTINRHDPEVVLRDGHDAARFASSLQSGALVWFRIRFPFESEEAGRSYFIKDFCARLKDGDVVIVDGRVREDEAAGMTAFFAHDLQTAARHFDQALREYETEECSFAIRELTSPYADALFFIGRVDEAGFRVRSALEMGDGGMSGTQLRLLGNLANVQIQQHQAHAACATYRGILEAATELGDLSNIGFAEAGIGLTYKLMGERVEAEAWLRRAVATARADGDRVGLTRRLSTLGSMLRDMERHEDAAACLAESLSVAMPIGDFHYVEETCAALWNACAASGNFEPFAETCEQLLGALPPDVALATRIHILNSLATLHTHRSEEERASERFEEALAIARGAGLQIEEAVLLANIGKSYASIGRYSEAKNAIRLSMRIAAQADAWPMVDLFRNILADVIAKMGSEAAEDDAATEHVAVVADWWFSQSLPE
jgi:tetratricopeptide (TPR) repeat protein